MSKIPGIHYSVGAGGGVKNYVVNGDFEAGLSGWSLASSTLDPTTKVLNQASSSWGAAAGTLSTSVITGGSQLSSTKSLSLASSAATTAGNFLVSNAFSIDKEDQAKVLTFSFSYQVVLGGETTNSNFSGTSSNSVGVLIYDATNNSWIQPAGVFNLTQTSGVGKAVGTFQTASNTAQLRIAIYFPNATVGALTLYVDSVVVGPQTVQYGAPVTDWQNFTPTYNGITSTGTGGSANGRWRRVGDSMELFVSLEFGAGPSFTGGPLLFELPTGYAIDASKVPSAGSITNAAFAGSGYVINDAGVVRYVVTPLIVGTRIGLNSSANVSTAVTNTSPFAFGAGDGITFAVKVPILGWSSTVQMSNDTDTRVVAFGSTVIGSQTLSYGVNAVLSFSSQTDSHSGFSGGTTYTIPVSGWYDVSTYILLERALNPPVSIPNALWIEKVGSGILATVSAPDVTYSQKTGNNGTFSPPCSVNGVFYFNSGDQIRINATSYGQNSTGNVSVTVSQGRFNVRRLSGPSAIAATETVEASYAATSATTLTASTPVTVIYNSKISDSHGAMNTSTGIYTVPVSGKYRISAQLLTAVVTFVSGNVLYQWINKNNSDLYLIGFTTCPGANTQFGSNGSFSLRLNAGDQIKIRGFQNSVNSPNTTTDSTTYFHIERIGN